MNNNTENITELEYNSLRTPLIIPEYGRHLQKLINLILEVKDKEQRNKMAKYIINIMGSLNPHLRDVPDFQHKLWDQLFIMSNFQLDVDSPFPIPSKEMLSQKPEPLAYPQNFPKYRYYGNNIKYMIDVANKWEEGEQKNALVLVIANHMKKCYLSWNKDTVTDDVIFGHLYEISEGKIDLLSANEELSNTQQLMKVNKKATNKVNFHNKNNGNGNKNKQKHINIKKFK